MNTARDDTLRVPGANLYYRVRGRGPLLLFLAGGDGDADTADALCDQLDDRYTVLTYDRRGLSRSSIDAGFGAPTLTTHGDDVHHFLKALTSEPASALGRNTVIIDGSLPDDAIRDMIEDSYDLVVSKLPHASRRAVAWRGDA